MKCPYCGQEMIDIKDYCVNCGKKLEDNAIVCVHCGAATSLNPQYMQDDSEMVNGPALAGMILGIISLVMGVFLLYITSIIGLICSIVGKSKVEEYHSGEGFAKAGLILNSLSLVVMGIILLSVLINAMEAVF